MKIRVGGVGPQKPGFSQGISAEQRGICEETRFLGFPKPSRHHHKATPTG